MAKGNYKKEFGGSKSGWEKGKKDAESKNLIVASVLAVGGFVLGLLFNKLKK